MTPPIAVSTVIVWAVLKSFSFTNRAGTEELLSPPPITAYKENDLGD